ncbi:MAG: hypothetical protein IJV96_01660 [Clostridia bacterium]|nr:hypothetical protein [Clostridia bacterium]
MKANAVEGKFIEYKGKPLVRNGNEIFYGYMSDKYYLFLMIMSEKKASRLDVQIPDMVMVQILPTDGSNKPEKQKIVSGLYEAFDIGTAWLERANRV